MTAPASTTYLFDQFRTGRLRYPKGALKQPKPVWQIRLPNDPPHSPESTAVFDENGNMYFGCHDGRFYSLSGDGVLRWSFQTGAKIYSSPTICNNDCAVGFASGDGMLYCLSLEGILLWKLKVGDEGLGSIERFIHRFHQKNSPTLHEVNRIASARSWASPNLLPGGHICVTGYRFGISVADSRDGGIKWRSKLGWPVRHLTGVAISRDGSVIAVGQQGPLVKLSGSNGATIWERSLRCGYNHWGNPSIDPDSGAIYVVSSHRENRAVVWSFDEMGRVLWRCRIQEASRGTVTISHEDYVICSGFGGNLYFIEKGSGRILKVKRVTSGKLWTSCSIDPNGYLFVSVIDSSERNTGRICCLDKQGEAVWDCDIGKGHSVPVIDHQGRLYCGSWRGVYYCFQT